MITATAQPATRREKIEIGRIAQWGIGLGVAGLLIAALSLQLGVPAVPSQPAPLRLLLDLLILVGMTLFALGVLGVILGRKSWKSYFEESLREVVLQPHYLKSLSPEGLRDHLIEIFKAEHGDEDIGREDRFLRYCLDHVHKYLSSPYRENLYVDIAVEAASPSTLKIRERIDYTCRQAAGGLPDSIEWQAASREVLSVEELKIGLRWPRGHPEARPKMSLGMEQIERETLPGGGLRFKQDLGGLGAVDGLLVCVEAAYLVSPSTFNTWRLTEPARQVDVTISYPMDLDLQYFPCMLTCEPDTCEPGRGSLSVRFDSWVLPGSGFAWKLVPAFLPESVRVGGRGDWEATLEDIVADGAD